MAVRWIVSAFLLIFYCADGYAAESALAYIVAPAEGAVVTNPVKVIFGLKNPYGVAPAGVRKDNTGHHHLLIDTSPPSLTAPIPKDENHRHFGNGQTEAEIELSPGDHTLQLLLGDFAHVPHDPPVMSERITITVE
ncbi:MAG TPA: DUF4399 domain-containing protein [Gammaproteobacteria bacterium]|jgi:hypothetical protein|nr:DUF4399 domain-containing protein [Gammaproteobacteria bacterium]